MEKPHYDSLGQVRSGKKHWYDGTPVAGQQFEYAFDDIGNRTQTKAGGDDSGAGLRPANYSANNLNQYTSRGVPAYIEVLGMAKVDAAVTVEGSSSGVYRRGEYFRKELNVNNASAAQYPTIDVDTDVTSPVSGEKFLPLHPESFSHDTDGNLTQDGRWDYVWDGENRLVKLRSRSGSPATERRLEFEYDWQGRRIRQTAWNDRDDGQGSEVSDTLYLYDGWNLIAELNANSGNAKVRTYIWGLDLSGTMQGAGGVGGLLMVIDHTGATKRHYAAYEGNGNVMGLVDSTTGDWSARYEYGPFGEPIRASGDLAYSNPIRWSTKYTDGESGLVYYGYRFYNSSVGRWLNRDPLGERAFLLSFLSGALPDEAKAIVGETVWDLMRAESQHSGYVLLANDLILKTDYLGLFGAGHNGKAGPSDFKGHSDFTGQWCFDYNLEDTDPKTKPFPGGKPENHFQDKGTSTKQVEAAVKACDASAFERAMHRLQDFWSHYNKGYRWNPPWQLGHALDGTKPDEDNAAWAEAEKATKEWVEKFHKACPCTKCKAPGATP